MKMHIGQSSSDLRIANRCMVLQGIVENPLIARSDLARDAKLSKMSVSNIVSELIENGVVKEIMPGEQSAGTNNPGRKAGLLDLADNSPCVLGVVITRWNIQVVLGDLRAHILRLEQRNYRAEMNQELLFAMIMDAIDAVRNGFERKILAVSVVSMGPVDQNRGTILSPSNFFGMHDVPVVEAVRAHTNLPVFFSSDSMAAAQAERLLGEGRNHSDFLFLLIHEGIGCGLIVDGRPYAGARGLSGELGHTAIDHNGPRCACGNRGCLETYASTGRILHHIHSRRKSSGKEEIQIRNWEEIWHAATGGVQEAVSAIEEYCDALSVALVNMVNVFDPELIFLYQHADRKADEMIIRLLKERINRCTLARDCRQIEICRATFGEQAVLVGSLALCIVHVFDGELSFC